MLWPLQFSSTWVGLIKYSKTTCITDERPWKLALIVKLSILTSSAIFLKYFGLCRFGNKQFKWDFVVLNPVFIFFCCPCHRHPFGERKRNKRKGCQQPSPFFSRIALSSRYRPLTHRPPMSRAVPGRLPSIRHLNFQWCPVAYCKSALNSRRYKVISVALCGSLRFPSG